MAGVIPSRPPGFTQGSGFGDDNRKIVASGLRISVTPSRGGTAMAVKLEQVCERVDEESGCQGELESGSVKDGSSISEDLFKPTQGVSSRRRHTVCTFWMVSIINPWAK